MKFVYGYLQKLLVTFFEILSLTKLLQNIKFQNIIPSKAMILLKHNFL